MTEPESSILEALEGFSDIPRLEALQPIPDRQPAQNEPQDITDHLSEVDADEPKFTCFSALPEELQLKIWRSTFSKRRTFIINFGKIPTDGGYWKYVDPLRRD
jgi:hypothetical protein